MNEDFRVNVNFFEHRKTKKLRRRLNDTGVLCLLQLWAYVARTTPKGDIGGLNAEDIEISAGWEGEPGAFVAAAVECGFIDAHESGYALHDWTDHNPWAADATSRSDASRLSRMAKTHPNLYDQLKGQGYRGISQKEYWALTHEEEASNDTPTDHNERSTVVNESLNESERGVKESLSPAPAPSPSPTPMVKDYSPSESEGETPPPEPERDISVEDVPAVMRPTVEFFLLKTGHTGLTPVDLSAVRALEKLHTPTRVNQEIIKAIERYDKASKPLSALTMDYIFKSLQFQTSGRVRKKDTSSRASPEIPEELRAYDEAANRRRAIGEN